MGGGAISFEKKDRKTTEKISNVALNLFPKINKKL